MAFPKGLHGRNSGGEREAESSFFKAAIHLGPGPQPEGDIMFHLAKMSPATQSVVAICIHEYRVDHDYEIQVGQPENYS